MKRKILQGIIGSSIALTAIGTSLLLASCSNDEIEQVKESITYGEYTDDVKEYKWANKLVFGIQDNYIFMMCIETKTNQLFATIISEKENSHFPIPSKVIWENNEYPVLGFGGNINSETEQYLNDAKFKPSFSNETLDFKKTNIKYIFKNAFANNANQLYKVVFSEKIQFLANNAFYNCKILTNVDMSAANKLKGISSNAFSDCQLSTLKLPPNLEVIEKSAFAWNKERLIEIELPQSLKQINAQAFYNCYALSKVNFDENSQFNIFPSNLEFIGINSFFTPNKDDGSRRSSLKNIKLSENTQYFIDKKVTDDNTSNQSSFNTYINVIGGKKIEADHGGWN